MNPSVKDVVCRPSLAFCAIAVSAVAWAADPPRQRPAGREPVTPAEKCRALEREELALDNGLERKVPGPELRQERERLRQQFAARMLELAAAYPDDPAAIDALGWVFGHLREGKEADQALKSLAEYAARDLSPKMIEALGRTIGRMSLTPEHEPFLREALANNRHRRVRASAGYRLAYLLKLYSRGDMHNPDPALAAKRAAEAERLFEKIIAEYGDIPSRAGTLADHAGAELFELRDLAIGKTVPEIEGEDLDGEQFKLSDYRGKVVMLGFWGDW